MPPTPVKFDSTELQSNEAFKTFDSIDALGTAYLDLHTKVSNGSIDILPEELRKDPSVSVFKSLPELARGFMETKKKVGTIKTAPEKPELYKINPVNEQDPDLKISDDFYNNFKIEAHKLGLHNEQVDGMNQFLIKALSKGLAQTRAEAKTRADQSDASLRQEWQGNYEKNKTLADRLITQAGGKEALDEFNGLGRPKNLLKSWVKVASLLSEDSIKSLGVSSLETTGVDAQQKIKAINQDSKHPYWNEKDPKHADAVKEMRELYKIAHPS